MKALSCKEIRVLYISYDGLTDPLGQSQVLPYLCGLARKGWKISIISFEKPGNYKLRRDVIRSLTEAHGIGWHPLNYTARPPVLSTVWDIFRMIRFAKKLHKQKSFTICHCRSYIAAFAGLSLKKMSGVKFIFDMRGFWADERVEGGIWNLKNPVFRIIYRYFKRRELLYLNHSDAVISLTDAGRSEMIQNFGISKADFNPVVIPCCADTAFFDAASVPPGITTSRKEMLGIEEDGFVVSYSGSVGTWYLPDEMLALFGKILQSKPNAVFLFITPDPREFILTFSRRQGIPDHKVITISASRNEMPGLLLLSDVSLFFIKPVYSKIASSPTKMAEIMSLGIPFVCNAGVGDNEASLKGAEGAFVMLGFSDDEMDRAHDWILSYGAKKYPALRHRACSLYSLSKGIDRYDSVYKEIISKGL